jgi:hypothetical protein
MTIAWQETADEIIRSLSLDDNEADRLPTARECPRVRRNKRTYIKTLRLNKPLSPDGIKAEIYQESSDITAPL